MPRQLFPILMSILLTLAGCAGQSPPTRFYLLSPSEQLESIGGTAQVVGIGPVILPDHLNRSQLVRRSSELRLEVMEFDRWAGDLAKNVQDVLATNLSRLLGGWPVLAHPWGLDARVSRQIVLVIRRFEAGPGDQVVLEAQWRLLDLDSSRAMSIENERIQVPLEGDGVEAMVRAQNRALAELSRRLAAGLLGGQDTRGGQARE